MTLLTHVEQALQRMGIHWHDEIILVGVSGGVDSLALLYSLHHLQATLGYQLQVASFDHGLRGAAGHADVEFVRHTAQMLGVPFHAYQAEVGSIASEEGLNLEEAARRARYTFLLETALEINAGFIAVGHHQDDQMETMLMHLLRGTGLGGLRGMLALAPLSESHLLESADDDLYDALEEVWLLRPFLEIPRTEINAYINTLGLTPREDATNSDMTFFRNRLRHEVIPLLEQLNPQLRSALGRTAAILQGDYEVLESMVIQTAAKLVEWDEIEAEDEDSLGGEVAYVDKHDFLHLSVGLQRHLLRHVMLDLLPMDLPFAQVESARHLIAHGQVGAELHLGELVLSIGYDEFLLYYGGPLPFPRYIPSLRERQTVPLDIEEDTVINDHLRFYSYWVLDGYSHDLARADPLEATLAIPPDAELNLRTRRAGDRFAPMGLGGHRQKLSDVFTNLKVPKAFRDRIPLLTVNDEIVWFVAPTLNGLQGRVAEQYAVRPDSEHILRVRWEAVGERITEWG